MAKEAKVFFYPNQRHQMRSKENQDKYLRLLQREGLSSFRGIKGPSALSQLIDNLPLSAPVDYMHQVLLGVTRSLLTVVRDKTRKSNLENIKRAVDVIQLTNDFKRSLRSIDELEYFKSNELKLWLLYIGPIVLKDNICNNLYDRFHLLSYATRLLLFSSINRSLADDLIKRFLFLNAEANTEKVFSANIHSLNHLAWQVGCYGPLWCTSAIMIESANYHLRCKFTGTVNHLKLLVERYVRNKALNRETPCYDQLHDLCFSFRKQKTFKRQHLAAHEAPNDLRFPNARFYTNLKLEYFVLDSEFHSSAKNSYVSFVSGGDKRVGQVRVFFRSQYARTSVYSGLRCSI